MAAPAEVSETALSKNSSEPTTEVVNRDPSFGSSLLNEDFGQRPTGGDDFKALDPLKLEGVEMEDSSRESTGKGEESQDSSKLDPLLRNPNGATQMFSDMHGVSTEIGEAPDSGDAKIGMQHMGGLTVGEQRLGATDWGCGTDGGPSGKPHDGIPYGFFTGA